jgi:hypothetical protein
LNRSKLVSPHFISGSELIAKWKADEAYGHNFMPEIETAYVGPNSANYIQARLSSPKEKL